MTEKTKQILLSLVKPFLWIGGILALIFVGKEIIEKAVLNNVSNQTNWKELTKTTISVYDKYENDYRKVKLPIDRRTGKRVKTDQIKAVGISDKGGKVNVQIKHKAVDRRGVTVNDTTGLLSE